jgi:hypothetical protein
VYGNHNIPFEGKEVKDKEMLISQLDSLQLENSSFLSEMCKKWHSPLGYCESWDRREQEHLAESLKIQSWSVINEEDDWFPHSLLYTLIGPYGIEIEISKDFMFISPWVGRYHHWFDAEEDGIEWRDTWRFLISLLLKSIGGDRALYFPDNMLELSKYLPTEYKNVGFNELIQIIMKEYKHVYIYFPDAIKIYRDGICYDPFVIDDFRDLQNLSLGPSINT